MKYLTPVIHVQTLDQTLRNVEICMTCGVKGFWLINHRISCNNLAKVAVSVRERFPTAWMGVNVLNEHPLTALYKFDNLEGYWTDDPQLIEGQNQQMLASNIFEAVLNRHKDALYFGSVAFKYQHQPKDLRNMTRLASGFMDVIVTSGDGTGQAADVEKVATMKKACHIAAVLGIASGITAENVDIYKPYVQWFLVATGISKDFENLDPVLVKALQEKLNV